MWILHFLPDSFIIFVVYAVLALGATLTAVSYLIKYIPFISQYKLPARIAGIMFLICGVYFYGGYSTEMQWRARVAEMQEKVKIVEKKIVVTNTKIQTKVVEKIKVVKEKEKGQIQYIEKEIVKYNDQCTIPKEFVKVLNEASSSPYGGKGE